MSDEVIATCRAIEAPGLRTFASAEPLALRRASGWIATGTDGADYLELGGFNGVANIGHAHPAVVAAIKSQADELIHCPTGHPSPARAKFYEALASVLPRELNAIFPNLTGAAANETAMLVAHARRPRGQFICFSGGYHGRSIGTVGLAGKAQYRESLGMPATAQFVPYPDPGRHGPDCVERTLASLRHLAAPGGGFGEIAAIMLEPVEGNCGVIVPLSGFLRELRKFADETGALLICDEIQSGAGRTGRMWAFEHEGIVPDIVTVGKGIGGGMPVSATITRRALVDWLPDTVAGTFIVNNVGLAAAEAAIRVIRDEGLPERSARLGATALARLRAGLGDCTHVREVRGIGLWLAVELASSNGETGRVAAGRILKALRRKGVIAAGGGYDGEVVKIAPPLNIDETVLLHGIDLLIEAVRGDAA